MFEAHQRLARGTQCAALAVSESKWFMLAFVLYYRSSANTSSRTHEQAMDYNSQCTPQGHVSAYLVPLHTIRRRFCRIHPVQMHHPHMRRPMSSIQSAYHHPLMHDAHHNRRIPDTKRGERRSAPYLRCSPRTDIETWALECVFYKKYSGCCDMAKVLCMLSTGSIVHIHQTLYGHIRTTYSCRLLFVLRTDMSMLLDSVVQHGIDGAHRQWFTLSYTMGDYHQVPSRLAL